MSNIKRVFKTAKGTEIPLLNLKGKEYLQVAHRLIILDETHKNYTVDSEMVQLTDTSAVVRSTITIFDDTGKVIRKSTSTKKETQKDFPDFIEKAETGSLGRALALVGIGTQFCVQDLEEGNRLADAPVFAKEEVKSYSAPSNFTKAVGTSKTVETKTETTSAQASSVIASSAAKPVAKASPFALNRTASKTNG
jgi:hypothetical protein